MEKLKRIGLSYKVASYVFYGNNVVFKLFAILHTLKILKYRLFTNTNVLRLCIGKTHNVGGLRGKNLSEM